MIRLPAGPRLRWLDAAVAVWVVVWVALAIVTAVQVRELRANGDLVLGVGQAIGTTADGLEAVASLPLVGGQVQGVADQLRAAADAVVESGRANRDSATRLSWILGLAIGLVPSVPLLGLYLPLRLGAARERRALQALLASGLPRRTLERVLADRALSTLPYDRLAAVAEDPWAEYDAGRHAALARAELDRHGLTLPPTG